MGNKIFKYRPNTVLIVIATVFISGITAGFLWKHADIQRMKTYDYRIYSQCILHRTDTEPAALLAALKKQLKENRIFVIGQYQVSATQWEVLGHPGRFWLTSEFLSKVTVVDTVAIIEGSGQGAQRTILAYLDWIETGSKEYMFLFFLTLAVTLVILVRREALPHIFDDGFNNGDSL